MSRGRHRIHIRLALVATGLALLLGMLVSVDQIAYDLLDERDSIDLQIQQMLYSVEATAAAAVDKRDPLFAERVIDGLIRYDTIAAATLYDEQDKLLVSQRKATDISADSWVAKWLVGQRNSYVQMLQLAGSDQPVGRIEVWVDVQRLSTHFIDRSLLTLYSALAWSLGLTLLLIILFYFFLTRPLVRTIDEMAAAEKAGEGRLPPIGTALMAREDELGTLSRSFNRLLLQREQAKKESQQLRNYLQNIIDSMPSVLIGVDADGRITQWNHQAAMATGRSAQEANGQPLGEIYPPLAQELEQVQRTIRERRPHRDLKIPLQGTGQGTGQGGFSDITIYPLIANGVDGAVIRVDDVTDKMRIEEMMIQSEKMMSIGGLAAGMAHEINNPLAGILQNMQVMKRRLSTELAKNLQVAESCGTDIETIQAYMEQRDLFSMIDTVIDSGQRAARIVENMLNFSRKSTSNRELFSLPELIDRTLELAYNDYDLKKRFDFRRIEIVREYQPDTPLVDCEWSKIQQVILNLLKNGAQAMASVEREEPCFTLRTRADVGMARIEVEDNGPGMDETIRKRVFEPFFTTKPVGEGTGLGLSVSYFIIVENHQGQMWVESQPGQGCRFVIRLPLHGGVHDGSDEVMPISTE